MLSELNRFKYDRSDSADLKLQVLKKLSFVITNTNLSQLVLNYFKATLETRKKEIEQQLIVFEL